MSQVSLLFLIPARGGSKGLPGKNLAAVGGIPLVGRAVLLARRSAQQMGVRCRIVCSTDDPSIADAATQWGADVPFLRPTELASDSARTSDVIIHALDAIGDSFDALVLLQPTSPLTEVEDVVGAVMLHRQCGMPVVSVCAAEHPVEWLFTSDLSARLQRLFERGDRVHQRQLSTPIVRLNGAVYISAPDAFRSAQTFLTPDTRGYLMPTARSIDIDTAADLRAARAIVETYEPETVRIGDREVGMRLRSWILADMRVSSPDLDGALSAIDAIADSGADGVRIPASFDASAVVAERCIKRGLAILSSETAEGVAVSMSIREIGAAERLDSTAWRRRSVFLAIGQSTLPEATAAVDWLRGRGVTSIIPLTSDLLTRRTLEIALESPVGFSAMTCSRDEVIAATALGAAVLEVPVGLDGYSRADLAALIRSIHDLDTALGRGDSR